MYLVNTFDVHYNKKVSKIECSPLLFWSTHAWNLHTPSIHSIQVVDMEMQRIELFRFNSLCRLPASFYHVMKDI